MIKEIMLVGLGGGVGSILRYLSAVCSQKICNTVFPAGTFFVNLLGCLIIGLLIGVIEHRQMLDENCRLLFVTGFCGGFTTFSAFSAESLRLFESGHVLSGILYVTASVLIGTAAVWLGIWMLKQ
ncbi:MAG: fluoride efflux transporter CrcB [Tannerella sp.]|jgi:CrcB protein|nr:fluoride efflux transporter CrcB [Tannerella sp.]